MFPIRIPSIQSFLPALAGGFLLFLPAPSARAVDVYQGAARFARAQKVEGEVTIGHAYQVASEFAALKLNDPIGEGDKVNLESGARLLVLFGNGSRIAATGPAQFELYRLNPAKPYEIRLYGGEVMFDNRATRAVYLDTNDGALTLNSRSQALFNDAKDGVEVTPLSGETVAGEENHPVRLHPGERIRLRHEQTGTVENAGRDAGGELAAWADLREQNQDQPGSRSRDRDDEADNENSGNVRERHVTLPADLVVYRDELDRHGRWRFDAGYGWAWHPDFISAGWMPYSSGFWRHTPWGVFWVSDEPWGWAPYHYGSWRYNPENGWFWIPGGDFGGAWVVFENDGDLWSWCPAYYNGGYWRPSYHNYIQINIVNFYQYHPPVVMVNHPNPGPYHQPPRLPSPPVFQGGPKGRPQRDGGPVRPPAPPVFQGGPKGRPQRDGGPVRPPAPPVFQGGPKGRPQRDGGPVRPPAPQVLQSEPKGRPQRDGGPVRPPAPPVFQGEPKGRPQRDGGPVRPPPPPPPPPPREREENRHGGQTVLPPQRGEGGGSPGGRAVPASPPAHPPGARVHERT